MYLKMYSINIINFFPKSYSYIIRSTNYGFIFLKWAILISLTAFPSFFLARDFSQWRGDDDFLAMITGIIIFIFLYTL